MKKIGVLLLGACFVLPVYAQDAADSTPADASPAAASPDAAAPTDTSAPATPTADNSGAPASTTDSSTASPAAAPDAAATPADAAPAASDNSAAAAEAPATPAADSSATPSAAGDTSSAPAADSSATPTDTTPAASDNSAAPAADASAATPATDSSASTDSSSDASASTDQTPRTPIKLYVGYDRTHVNFQISGEPAGPVTGPTPPATTPQSPLQQQFGSSNLSSNFNQIRVGVRAFDVIGIEAHYGHKATNGTAPGTVAVKNYEGIYLVPTGTLLGTVEVGAVLGYDWLQMERPGASAKLHGIAYGVNAELPIRVLWDKLPNIRLGGGVMVYQHDSRSRVYGTHFGVRYDFSL
ncbi:MAG: hypothetical protein ACRESS_05825 [Stenotrophobium sp.]